jgi:hypothetical protein
MPDPSALASPAAMAHATPNPSCQNFPSFSVKIVKTHYRRQSAILNVSFPV